MARHGRLGLGIVVTFGLLGSRLIADPPATPPLVSPAAVAPTGEAATTQALETTLALQKAMVMAKTYLRMDEPHKAVEILEQNLSRVNGHANYLELLRDAYRAYIKDLFLKNQTDAANRYLQRLVILDPAAAADPTLRPEGAPKFVPAAPKEEKLALPNFSAAHGSKPAPVDSTPPAASLSFPTATPAAIPAPTVSAVPVATPRIEITPSVPRDAVKAPVIRAIRELPGDDPFDASNQRIARNRIAALPTTPTPVITAGINIDSLLAKGNEEFVRRNYAQAKTSYEEAVKIQPTSLEKVRDRLAYCMLDGVIDQLARPNPSLDGLRQQIRDAQAMAPQLRGEGEKLLKEIDLRGRTSVAGSIPETPIDPPLNMQHFGKNPQGWMVTETTNFRVFHNQNRELVEQVVLIAERTRAGMGRKWLGADVETWSPKCEVVLHATAADYARLTNVPASSPGHSRIETDPVSYRVIGRRIDLHVDTLGMLEAVLPHETTHVVLAGHFGVHAVPRWADEGVAVLTEPSEKIEQHRRNLIRGKKEGTLFPIRELMDLQNYPQPRQISAFYAQSVMLVEFLTQMRGPQVFTAFLRDGLQSGYETALRTHYNWTFTDLQANWDRHVLGGPQAVAAGR